MTRYQLQIHAEKLPHTGLFGRRHPDPQAIVKVTGGPREGEVLGKTEVVESSVHPDFTRALIVETTSSEYLPIRITIKNVRNDMVLAEADFEATEIAAARGHMQSKKTKNNGGVIHASMEESIKGTSGRGKFTLHLRGLDIKNIEPGLLGLGRSDPFYEISKKDVDHAAGLVRWNVVHRSHFIRNHLNPYWNPVTLSLEEICYCDLNWPLKIAIWDHSNTGKHTLIGEFETNIQQLTDHISIKGNADRDRAFNIQWEGRRSELNETRGLIVVLKSELLLDEPPPPQAAQQAPAPAPVVVPSQPYSAGAPPGPYRPMEEQLEESSSSPARVVVPSQPYSPAAAPGPYRPTEDNNNNTSQPARSSPPRTPTRRRPVDP